LLHTSSGTPGDDDGSKKKMSPEELKNHLKAMIPDSAEVELDPGEPISLQDVQRQRYMDKFRQVSVDVSAVTQRVLRMCGSQRRKSKPASRTSVGRNAAHTQGAEHQTIKVSDYAEDQDLKVGLYKRTGLAGGLREGPRLYVKEPLMDRVRASTQLSSYAATADHTASQKPGSALGLQSTEAVGNANSKTKPSSPTRRKP